MESVVIATYKISRCMHCKILNSSLIKFQNKYFKTKPILGSKASIQIVTPQSLNNKRNIFLITMLLEVFVSTLLVFEMYHVITHILVLTGCRTLPRKTLAKQKYYFLVDLITSFISFMIHGRFWFIIMLQNIQHAFYFATWPDRW